MINLIGGFLILFVPYMIFNWLVAGDLWPNTFYAKQAEYSILRQTGLLNRYIRVSLQFITGIGVVLIPGIGIKIWDIIKNKSWDKSTPLWK